MQTQNKLQSTLPSFPKQFTQIAAYAEEPFISVCRGNCYLTPSQKAIPTHRPAPSSMGKQVKLMTRVLQAQHMLISSKWMLFWPCFKLPGVPFSLSSHSGWVRSFATKEALSPCHQPILWVSEWDTIPTQWQTCRCVCQQCLEPSMELWLLS